MQNNNHATINGVGGGRSMNNDGEFSDEVPDRERPASEEPKTASDRRKGKQFEGMSPEDPAAESPWEVKEEKSENQGSSTGHDPLLESMFTLQTAQEKLEREVQKFKETRIEDVVNYLSLQDDGLPSDFTSGDTDFAGLSMFETEVVSLQQNVILLQSKLNEAADLVKSKEARVIELETILSSSGSKKEEKSGGNDLHQNTRDIESELEGLFRHKIEAEVEYLAISRTIQYLRAEAVDQVTLSEEPQKHRGSVNKAAQAENSKKYCDDVTSSNKTVELWKRVYKYSSYFFIQLVLLVVVIGLYILQMSPDSVEVAPT